MNKYEATEKITDYKFWEDKPTMADIQECIDAGADLTELVLLTQCRTRHKAQWQTIRFQ